MWNGLSSLTVNRSRLWFAVVAAWLLGFALAGCGGGGGVSIANPPAGLVYSNNSVVYLVGMAIVPNTPSSSGGQITQYSVEPVLPAGLSLNPATGVISGAPTAVTNAAVYTVTGTNGSGTTTARVQIEVSQPALAPETLSYLDSSPIYTTGAEIPPNMPITTGGEITSYSVAPALPAGLSLNAVTGVITGTPTAVAAAAVYTVTGSNSVGSLTTQLTLAVQASVVPPSSLSYSDPAPVYVVGEPIVTNTPSSSGGEITQYSVAPTLPEGLSLNTVTGEITGTPAQAVAQASYTVTGSNSAGTESAVVSITIIPASVGEFQVANSMSTARTNHTATLLPNGQVLVAGGSKNSTSSAALSSAELYNPSTGTWTTTGSMNTARINGTATLLPNGTVLVAGGSNNGVFLSSAELYDPATGAWTTTGSMSTARTNFTATLLPNGTVLVAGGSNSGGLLSSAELYDPATGTWTTTGSMSTTRTFHIATLLPNGTVLAAGGFNGSYLSSAELYNPATGTWSTTGAMNTQRGISTATLLPNGQVLAVGGFNGSFLSSAELYNPATGTWSTTGAMNTQRAGLTAMLLSNGQVLVAGGTLNGAVTQSSAELYDPATGTWTTTGSMSIAREFHAATLLPNGNVLITGGVDNGNTLSSSELYVP